MSAEIEDLITKIQAKVEQLQQIKERVQREIQRSLKLQDKLQQQKIEFDRDMDPFEKETLVVSKCRLCGNYLIQAFANPVDHTKLALHEWKHARSCEGASTSAASS
jgi:hypothetical protein